MIYLDNAASTFPKPKNVLKDVFELLRDNTSNPGRSGHAMSQSAAQKVYECRHKIAAYFGCTDEHVLFMQNATYAVNTLFKGLLQPGDHVIISDLEHNCVLRPLETMKSQGITYSCFNTDLPPEQIEDLILPCTKLIFVCHASNVTGKVLDIATIARIARQHNIYFGIDASQSAGHLRYNIEKDGIDFVCTSGHKSLFGLQGSGLLLFKKDNEVKPLVFGGTGTESLNPVQPDILPEYFESGTLNTPAIVSLGAGIDFLNANEKKIVEKDKRLANIAYDQLAKINGITLYSERGGAVPVLSFAYKNAHSEVVSEYLDKHGICVRGGYHCSALAHNKLQTTDHGLIRIGLSVFNTASDIEKLCFYLRKLNF